MPIGIITILAFLLIAPAHAFGDPNDDAARKQQQQREKETPRWICIW